MRKIADELLSAYLDGALTDSERAEVAEYLAATPSARLRLEDLVTVRSRLRALPKLTLEANFRETVLQRIAQSSPNIPHAAPRGPGELNGHYFSSGESNGRRSKTTFLLAVAASLMLCAVPLYSFLFRVQAPAVARMNPPSENAPAPADLKRPKSTSPPNQLADNASKDDFANGDFSKGEHFEQRELAGQAPHIAAGKAEGKFPATDMPAGQSGGGDSLGLRSDNAGGFGGAPSPPRSANNPTGELAPGGFSRGGAAGGELPEPGYSAARRSNTPGVSGGGMGGGLGGGLGGGPPAPGQQRAQAEIQTERILDLQKRLREVPVGEMQADRFARTDLGLNAASNEPQILICDVASATDFDTFEVALRENGIVIANDKAAGAESGVKSNLAAEGERRQERKLAIGDTGNYRVYVIDTPAAQLDGVVTFFKAASQAQVVTGWDLAASLESRDDATENDKIFDELAQAKGKQASDPDWRAQVKEFKKSAGVSDGRQDRTSANESGAYNKTGAYERNPKGASPDALEGGYAAPLAGTATVPADPQGVQGNKSTSRSARALGRAIQLPVPAESAARLRRQLADLENPSTREKAEFDAEANDKPRENRDKTGEAKAPVDPGGRGQKGEEKNRGGEPEDGLQRGSSKATGVGNREVEEANGEVASERVRTIRTIVVLRINEAAARARQAPAAAEAPAEAIPATPDK